MRRSNGQAALRWRFGPAAPAPPFQELLAAKAWLGHGAWVLWCCACHSGEPLALPDRPATAVTELGRLSSAEPLPGPVQSLALGTAYTCALLTGGAVKCWGSDEDGILGRDTAREDVADPQRIGPIDFGTSRRVVQLTAGWHHACVLFEDGRARCWGQNERGQLGSGNTEDYGDDPGETLSALPDLPLEHIVAVSAGVSNTCAIVAADGIAGTVHCWGSDATGGIGDGGSGDFGDDEALDVSRPVPLPGWADEVASGDSVSCALLQSGAVHCWGNDAFGTLGIGGPPCNAGDERFCQGSGELRPVQELGEQSIHSVQLNQAHACALDNVGALRCWGRNDQSRAGYPDAQAGTVLSVTPGPVNLGRGVQVLAFGLGMRHGCALDATGDIRCWGEAGPQLGYGMPQQDGIAGIGDTLTPGEQYAGRTDEGIVQLADPGGAPGNGRALRVFSGGSHNCAILATGNVRCWGHNEAGQLGYGEFSQVGDIGAQRSPALDYRRLDQYDVCVVPAAATHCSTAPP